MNSICFLETKYLGLWFELGSEFFYELNGLVVFDTIGGIKSTLNWRLLYLDDNFANCINLFFPCKFLLNVYMGWYDNFASNYFFFLTNMSFYDYKNVLILLLLFLMYKINIFDKFSNSFLALKDIEISLKRI